MAPELLHERVDGEWSFIETLRHLVFATDAWVKRAILGDPSPWDPLDLPHDEMPNEPSIPRDREARPSLDEVLALRADRMATVRQVLAGLTDARLAGHAPCRSPNRAIPSRRASRYAGACRPSSARSGSTGSTPNGTSTCSRPGRTDPPGRPSRGPAYAVVHARPGRAGRLVISAGVRPTRRWPRPHFRTGEFTGAERLFAEAQSGRRIPSALVALGEAELAAGNLPRAVELLRRAVPLAHEAGLLPWRIADAEQNLRQAEAAAAVAASAEPR